MAWKDFSKDFFFSNPGEFPYAKKRSRLVKLLRSVAKSQFFPTLPTQGQKEKFQNFFNFSSTKKCIKISLKKFLLKEREFFSRNLSKEKVDK